jgi:hypothetical protein
METQHLKRVFTSYCGTGGGIALARSANRGYGVGVVGATPDPGFTLGPTHPSPPWCPHMTGTAGVTLRVWLLRSPALSRSPSSLAHLVLCP